MSYPDVRDVIKARLLTVSNIGVINDYRRGAKDWTAFSTAFMTTVALKQQIRGWDVAWESGQYAPEAWESGNQMLMAGEHVYVVSGYMSHRDGDATDREFSSLIQSVMKALVTCMASATRRQSHVPVMLRSNAFLNFEVPTQGVALIHHCEIEVRVMDEETI